MSPERITIRSIRQAYRRIDDFVANESELARKELERRILTGQALTSANTVPLIDADYDLLVAQYPPDDIVLSIKDGKLVIPGLYFQDPDGRIVPYDPSIADCNVKGEKRQAPQNVKKRSDPSLYDYISWFA